jgi:hypothetical protein
MADATINFNNQTEAIKEWIDVLGLSTTPTSTTSQTITGHQWTRQSWQDSCGFTVLDAWAEANGPHGTDANLNATYVIPFLDLDKTGATDPEQCGAGATGAGGAGGSSAGGSNAAGGSGAGGASAAGAGGKLGTAGSVGTGGSSGSTSSAGGGGANQSGGNAGSSAGFGGAGGSSSALGGSAGSAHAGGSNIGGGGSASGASGAGPLGTSGSSTLNAGSAGQADSASSGCSCHLAQRSSSGGPLGLGALLALSSVWSRRRRTKRLSSRSAGV